MRALLRRRNSSMNDSSPDLHVPAERAPESDLVDLLRIVHKTCKTCGIDYFVAGAMARDLILFHVFGEKPGRLTRDVDLGIRVNDWDQFRALKTALTQTGHFSAVAEIEHRLLYRQGLLPLDLVPFGDIQSSASTIAWPPTGDIVMSIAGFSEARRAALSIEIVVGFIVPVASIPSLAILKLVAWNDRHAKTNKDASDLLLLTKTYASIGNLDRLYESECVLLQEHDYHPGLAGAALLGKDAALLCLPEAAQIIQGILRSHHLRQRLIDQMIRSSSAIGSVGTDENPEPYLDAFARGYTGMPD